MKNKIISIIKSNLPGLTDLDFDECSDLYSKGMSSLQAVSLMMDIEDSFEIRFPHTYLNENTFKTVDSIKNAILTIKAG